MRYETQLSEREPVDAILDAAASHRVDIIVRGGPNHGEILDRVTGSITAKVTHRARTPVVVVPAAACRVVQGTVCC